MILNRVGIKKVASECYVELSKHSYIFWIILMEEFVSLQQ